MEVAGEIWLRVKTSEYQIHSALGNGFFPPGSPLLPPATPSETGSPVPVRFPCPELLHSRHTSDVDVAHLDPFRISRAALCSNLCQGGSNQSRVALVFLCPLLEWLIVPTKASPTSSLCSAIPSFRNFISGFVSSIAILLSSSQPNVYCMPLAYETLCQVMEHSSSKNKYIKSYQFINNHHPSHSNKYSTEQLLSMRRSLGSVPRTFPE